MTQQQQCAYDNLWGNGPAAMRRSQARQVKPGIWVAISVNI